MFDATAPSAAACARSTIASGWCTSSTTGLTDLVDMRSVAKLIIDSEMPYDGGANPRDNIAPNVYEIGAPLAAWLHYHHEMAYVRPAVPASSASSPRMCCLNRGQETTASAEAQHSCPIPSEQPRNSSVPLSARNSRNSASAITATSPIAMSSQTRPSSACTTTGRNHSTLTTPNLAASRARDQRLAVEWGPDRLLKTRFYCSAFEYFDHLDRNVLYSSLADHGMWFDTWPLVQHLPYQERPLHMTFGDDSEISPEEIQEWVDLYDEFGMPINWRTGDVGVICNYRWAHGRPGIHLNDGEVRKLGVVLGDQYDRVGVRTDKW